MFNRAVHAVLDWLSEIEKILGTASRNSAKKKSPQGEEKCGQADLRDLMQCAQRISPKEERRGPL
jgi:hypothetical protein